MSHALQISNGFYDPAALAWTIAPTAFVAIVLSGALRRIPAPASVERLPIAILAGGLAWAFVEHATSTPGFYLDTPVDRAFHVMLAAGALSVALIALDPHRARVAWFPAALAVYAGLGIWMIAESPNPHIDVYTVYNKALQVLRAGHSPYSLTFTNIYGDTDFYADSALRGSDVNFGFPYPPLALLMALPGAVLGDPRYAQVGAMVVGAAAFGYAGRSRTGLLAAALLLFTPRGLFVIEQAWSEPFVICWLGLLVYAATRREHTPVLLGALLAVKQHLVVALPFAPWLCRAEDRRGRIREIGLSLVVAAAVTVPFLVADPRGFWHSVVALQFAEPFRWDSLSVLVPIARAGWTLSPGMLLLSPVAAMLAAGLLAWRRAPRTAAGFATALGFVFAALFLCSKKAFCNYYFLVLACWCGAVAAADGEAPPPKA